MKNEVLYALAAEQEKAIAAETEQLNHFLFEHPELGGDEYISVKYLTEYLASKGFKVTCPLGSQETAFRADFGDNDGPCIAFLAEYDALPGYGVDQKPAHACGHNYIAAHSCACAVVLSRMKEHFHGKVSVIGAPAEETYGGKVIAVREGFYNDVDIAIQAHPSPHAIFMNSLLAMSSFKYTFHGKAAHAAVMPWEGVNALDAVIEMFVGVNAMRQHIKPDARIHGIITKGGQAPNIVPDLAQAYFMVRAEHRAYVDEICEKMKAIAEGAAKMTGTTVDIIEPDLPFDNLVRVRTLEDIGKKHLALQGLDYQEMNVSSGSSDVGDVSFVCPAIILGAEIRDGEAGFMPHQEETLYMADGRHAYESLHAYVNVAVRMALDLYMDPSLIVRCKLETEEGRKAK